MKILMVDDHPVFLKGLAMVLRARFDGSLIEEEMSGEKAISKILSKNYDLVILDFRLKDITGLEILNAVKAKVTAKFIMLTMYDDEEIAGEVLKAGIDGYILKENAAGEILTAIDRVFNGKKYVDKFFETLDWGGNENALQNLSSLTAQEKKILKLISQSLSSKQIAASLNISVNTVENHRANLAGKLNLKGSKSLIAFAIENRSLINTL